MKRILMVVLILGVMVSPVFAVKGQELTGTVSSINPIDPERGDFEGDIILRDDSGTETSFYVTTATVISDKATGKIGSEDIHDGNRVMVGYSDSGEGLFAETITRI